MSRLSNRRTFWLFSVTALLCVLALGGGVLISQRNAIPKIEIAPLPPLPDPNGFDLYAQSSRAITPATPAVDPNQENVPPLKGAAAQARYSLARRTAWLRANAAGFALFDAAQAAQTRHPDPALDGSVMAALKNYGQFRQMARWKQAQANTFVLEKRPADAMDAVLDVAQMSFGLRKDAPLIGYSVFHSVTLLGLEPAQNSDDLPEQLNAAQTRAALGRLGNLMARRSTLSDMIEMTRRQALGALRSDWSKPAWRADWIDAVRQTDQKDAQAQIWRLRVVAPAEILHNVNLSYDQAATLATSSYSKRMMGELPEFDDPISEAWGAVLRPQTVFLDAKEKVALDLLALRLALQLYKLQNGVYPTNLNALQNDILKTIPTDEFADGKPFRYVKTGQTYRLWSVGPDGKDNGGKPSPWIRSHSQDTALRGKHWPAIMAESQGDWVAGRNR